MACRPSRRIHPTRERERDRKSARPQHSSTTCRSRLFSDPCALHDTLPQGRAPVAERTSIDSKIIGRGHTAHHVSVRILWRLLRRARVSRMRVDRLLAELLLADRHVQHDHGLWNVGSLRLDRGRDEAQRCGRPVVQGHTSRSQRSLIWRRRAYPRKGLLRCVPTPLAEMCHNTRVAGFALRVER